MSKFDKHNLLNTVRLFGLAAFIYTNGAMATTSDEFVDEAQEYLQNGEFNAAVIQLKNALQEDPDNARARFILGLTYLDLNEGAAAEKELRHARRLGVDEQELLLPMARALMMQGQAQRVLDETKLPENASDETKTELFTLHGQAEMALGNIPKAKEAFDKAIEADVINTRALLGLSQIAVFNQEYELAGTLVEQSLEIEPGNEHAWVIRGELARFQGDLAASRDAFSRALESNPENVTARLGRASVLIGLQEFEQAEKDVQSVFSKHPEIPSVNHLRAVLAYQNQDMPGTEAALNEVLKVAPDHLPSLLLLGASLYAQEKYEQAVRPLERYLSSIPGNPAGRKLLGATHLKLGQPGEAISVLDVSTDASGQDAQWLALLGSAYSQAGDTDKATEWLEKAVSVAPDTAALRNQLALSHLQSGQTDQAVSELESAVDLGQDVMESDVLLIFARLRNQQFDEALTAAQALAEKLPDNPMPHNLLGAVYGAQRDFESARAEFEKALKLSPDFHAAAINLARLDAAAGDVTQAEQRLERILESNPDHSGAMMSLAELALRQGRQEDTLNWLQRAREVNPADTRSGMALARFYLQRGNHLDAAGVTRELLETHPENVQVLELQGNIRMAMGEPASAEENYQKAADLQPESPRFLWLLANSQAVSQRSDAALKSIDQALSLQPDYFPALVLLGRLKLAEGDAEAALEAAKNAVTANPGSAQGYMLEGDVYLAGNNYGNAEKSYMAGIEKQNTQELVIRLFQTRSALGDLNAAIVPLEEWIADNPRSGSVRQVLAQAYLQTEQTEPAIEQYQALLEVQPENIVALNNLAWLYHSINDDRAIERAEQAYNLAPDRPEVADTLGWLLVESGDAARGLEILQDAAGKAPHIPAIRFHRAVALAKNNRQDEARKELERLLRDHSNFAEEAEARVLLAELQEQ